MDQEDLEIQQKGAEEMWANVNTKPLQGMMFQVMRSQVMGSDIEYDDDVKRRRTHPLLLPKKEAEGQSRSDTEILEEVDAIVPNSTSV